MAPNVHTRQQFSMERFRCRLGFELIPRGGFKKKGSVDPSRGFRPPLAHCPYELSNEDGVETAY